MKTKIEIFEATVSDWDDIWEIICPVFRCGETYAVDPNISEDDGKQWWLTGPQKTFVAKDSSKTVGTYYLKPNHSGGGNHVCNCGYIVDRSSTGKGIASAMCRHSIQTAKSLGYMAMQFNFVVSTNEGAIRLWKKHGFQVVGTVPNSFRHPTCGLVDSFVMYQQFEIDNGELR